MRISDWSSDVCSSDLLVVQGPMTALANPDKQNQQSRDGQSRYEVAPYNYLPLVLANEVRLRIALMVVMMQSWTYQLSMAAGVEIGRASWRERVCQYV